MVWEVTAFLRCFSPNIQVYVQAANPIQPILEIVQFANFLLPIFFSF